MLKNIINNNINLYKKKSSCYELYKIFYFFNNLFKPICSIKINDKIGCIDKNIIEENDIEKEIKISDIKWELYIDTMSYYQYLSRYYYQQNRNNVFIKLNIIIDTYVRYKKLLFSTIYNLEYNELKQKIIELDDNIINALNILSNTYKDDKTIIKKINNLIDKLLVKNLFIN